MNYNEQRIAISKATGCNMKIEEDGFWVFSQPGQLDKRVAKHHSEEDAWRLCAKNYPTDLNACADFEKTLTDDQLITYEGWLIAVAGISSRRATAKERCDAFCLTLGIMKP